MSTERTITAKAADGVLTIAELKDFINEFDSATAQTPGEQTAAVYGLKLKARVSVRGGIKTVTVTVPGTA